MIEENKTKGEICYMAKQTNYAAKKEKIEALIIKLGNDAEKIDSDIMALTEKKKLVKKKLKAAMKELEETKKDEMIQLVTEKNLSTEDLEKILQA